MCSNQARRRRKISNFSARFFRNRFGNLLNAAKKCTQIEPAAGEKFSNFSARFFEIALVICWMLLKNMLKLPPPQAKFFPICLLVFFRNRFGNVLNAAQKICSNWVRRRRKILRIWGLIFMILRGIKWGFSEKMLIHPPKVNSPR